MASRARQMREIGNTALEIGPGGEGLMECRIPKNDPMREARLATFRQMARTTARAQGANRIAFVRKEEGEFVILLGVPCRAASQASGIRPDSRRTEGNRGHGYGYGAHASSRSQLGLP